jgi:fumarylacetoacetase
MNEIDETHDPALQSFVESANDPTTDFPIQNLPLGVARRRGRPESFCAVAIGDRVLDLSACEESGLFDDLPVALRRAVSSNTLNLLMEQGRRASRELRRAVSALLQRNSTLEIDQATRQHVLLAFHDVELLLPARIGDYTDFYASIHHASNVGALFRPDQPLLPNYKWVPIGYHGRASTIVVSGTPIRRPNGQRRPDPNVDPEFGASRSLDHELELGFWFGGVHEHGSAIPMARADEHLFGFSLVNDWSARDVQAFEYQPLGPFLAKNFATSISPWVVTTEALAPFRVAQKARAAGDPQPLSYLRGGDPRAAFDVEVEAHILTANMRAKNMAPQRLSRGSFTDMYWTAAQMLTHHASNGCRMVAGDLLASGTISGPEASSRGCLLELTTRGRDPIRLSSGEERRFLEDGDEVVLSAHASKAGHRRIGFGVCSGRILPAPPVS